MIQLLTKFFSVDYSVLVISKKIRGSDTSYDCSVTTKNAMDSKSISATMSGKSSMCKKYLRRKISINHAQACFFSICKNTFTWIK